ncbi:ABC transporter permease [Corynebacterium terpenotabidum]|uniref:Efflux ABC transporter permease n=1 Tax=Corynebacterium terpenotabidum Y-11 TaxID=1200352 RepID=S4XFT2_9CORY|nr:FtsX-like permease family protein [Corynebacterium terpenotabidum]AGP31439.1 efflux ABC transporter permease [Corynebacterium terpenotabidum Y-11]
MRSTTLSLVGHELSAFRRSGALFVAVLFGGILVVVGAVLGASLNTRVDAGAGVNYEGADLVVRSSTGAGAGIGGSDADPTAAGGGTGMSPEDVRSIAALDGVASADGLTRARAALWAGGDVTPTVIESLPADNFRWQRLTDGHYPQTGTEVALSTETMAGADLSLGDEVTMGTDESGTGQFTVVGVIDTRGALDYTDTDYAVVTPELAQAFAGTDGVNEVRVALAPGADLRAVTDGINAAVPGNWPESTASLEKSTRTLYDTGLSILSFTVNGFALITAVVALTVVGTVTWASLPGRRRQLALMRLIGASRGQVMAVLVLEVAVIALAAGLLAIPLGIGASYLALPLLGTVPGVPAIPWSDLTVPVATLVGVPVVAVLGAVLAVAGPAFAAGRVPPADAVRRSGGTGRSRPRAVTARLVAVPVLAVLVTVAARVAGTGTTAVVALAFVLALVLAVPALCWAGAGLAARITGDRHPLAEIGAAEIRSFPGRTAATGMAVVVASLVMAVSWVGLSSLSAIADARSSDDPGPGIMVGAYSGGAALDPVVLEALTQVDGVAATVPVDMAQVRLTGEPSAGAASTAASSQNETRMIADMVAGDAADYAAITGGRFPLDASDPDTVYLPATDQAPFRDGSTVTLTGPAGDRAVTVRYVADLPVPGLIAPAATADVGIVATTPAVWVAVDGEADRGDVLDAVRTVATIGGDLPVTGTIVTDAKIDAMVTSARLIATAMLVVAVVIAVIGAVVTLTASLRDRAGEFAVLRLLGMEGAQLRHLVGAETIAVGVVSVLVGLAAGVLMGGVAASVIAGTLGVGTQIAVPVVALLIMGVVTVVGLRAAVTGPVDRISLVAPADALRDANLGGNQ